MKRDIFRRGVRMTHKFGEIEGRSDPVYGNEGVFDPKFPVSPTQQHSPPLTIQSHGEFRYFSEPGSAVAKPTGSLASLNGPQPDYAGAIAFPIPMGTRQRLGTRAKKDKG
jgi:hypothetical protein